MPRIPLPQEPLAGGSLGGFSAPGVAPVRSVAGQQIQQLGRAVESTAGVTANIASIFQADVDAARTKEAFTLWNDQVRQTLHDPEAGYLNTRGKAGTGSARVDAQRNIAERAEEISQGLDPDQRRRFQLVVDQRTVEVSRMMDVHEAKSIREYDIGQAKAMSESSANDAVEAITITPANPEEARNNAETFQIHRLNAIQQAMIVADGLGYGEAQTDALVLETTTSIHAGVIGRFLSQDRASEARDYLEGVDSDEIDPATRTALNNGVARGTLNEGATTLALDLTDEIDAEIQTETPLELGPDLQIQGDPTAQATELQMLDRARVTLNQRFRDGTISAEMRDSTFDRIRRTARDRRDAEVVSNRETLDQSEAWLVENQNAGVNQLPTELFEDLKDSGQLDNIFSFATNRRYQTDPQVFAQLLDASDDELSTLTPGQFYLRFRPHLDGPEWDQARAKHARAVSGPGQISEQDQSILSASERVTQAARESGVLPRTGDAGAAEQDRFFLFQREVQRRVQTATAQGQPTTGEALQQIIDSVTVDTAFERGVFSDTEVPIAVLSPEEREDAVVVIDGEDVSLDRVTNAIPIRVADAITQVLRRQGRPITRGNIAQLWISAGRPASVDQAVQAAAERPAVELGGLTPSLPTFPGDR